ncbi:uncharacterized protein LOC144449381 [Glandiceps talaboti]
MNMERFNPEDSNVVGVAWRPKRFTAMLTENTDVPIDESPSQFSRKSSLRQSIRERLPLQSNNSKSKGKAVKSAFNRFTSKLRVSKRYKRERLEISSPYKSPKTPKNGGRRQRLQNITPENMHSIVGSFSKYRGQDLSSPITPIMELRRSERIANRTPTPSRSSRKARNRKQTPRRFKLESSPNQYIRELEELTSQFNQRVTAISSGKQELEKMAQSLSDSIEKQDENGNDDSGISIPEENKEDEKKMKKSKSKQLSRNVSYLEAQENEPEIMAAEEFRQFGEFENLI